MAVCTPPQPVICDSGLVPIHARMGTWQQERGGHAKRSATAIAARGHERQPGTPLGAPRRTATLAQRTFAVLISVRGSGAACSSQW